MKKYLMTVMAAVALGGMFSGCTKEIEGLEGGSSAQLDVIKNYEEAFITRFGQPAETQTWGFGKVSASTRAVVGVVEHPSVTEIGYTFNATMAKANYTSWSNSGWDDKFYQVNGTVTLSNIDPNLRQRAYKTILEEIPEGGPGNGQTNLTKASATGYSIVTVPKGGPVTLTPIYHQSSSGDMISYYYYPNGTTPDVKTLKKYTIGNMANPDACMTNINALDEYTYSLVYEDEDGNVSYDFPGNYVINFIVSNTDKLHNGTLTIDDTEPTLTSQGRYALPLGETIQSGTEINVINDKVRIKFGNTFSPAEFTETEAVQQANQINIWGNWFNYCMKGNGVNGSLNTGSTCYYFKANSSGVLHVAVRADNPDNIKVYEIGDNWDGTDNNVVTLQQKPTNDKKADDCAFSVTQGKVYAVYAENEPLWYYGYAFVDPNQGRITELKPLDEKLGPYACGFAFDESWSWAGFNNIYCKLGKAPTPVYFETTIAGDGNHPIENFPYLTVGNGNNGGFGENATTYFLRPTEAGVLRVAVKLSADKTLKVIDLGEWGWYNTRGNEIISDYKSATDSYYGTYDFDVVANHVYAVYAEGSKLGFYGCEFLTKTTPSANAKKTIDNYPEFYGDGNYNTEIHSCGLSQWDVNPDNTPHVAVFDASYTDGDGNKVTLNLIGFEDWTDLDFNDVIFAVTGTRGGEEIEIEEPEPEPICRIITEDLNATVGENDDYDFNDVVFDVCPDAKNNSTILIVRCIGGELPLYIAQAPEDPLDESHEVHKICNIGARSMTNTGWDGAINYEKECGRLVLPGVVINSRQGAWGIRITVVKKGVPYELTAKQREVPSKICVGPDYRWCHERTDIDDMYHKDGNKYFTMYVGGAWNDDDWENGNAWYQQPLE